MLLLTEFLLRLAFGLAGGMLLVSPRLVTSGYFRNHLYVTMGLALLAALLSGYAEGGPRLAFWPAASAALLSYVASVAWLYERPTLGKVLLATVAVAALAGAGTTAGLASTSTGGTQGPIVLAAAHLLASGAVLGVVMAAMLLGHWYLNSPGMALAPLRRLLVAAGVVIALHAAICATGATWELGARSVSTQWWLFLALRWSFGLVGVAVLLAMAWQTLKIPNTQSATGILYVAVIGTFVGETMSLLLGAESAYPL